jgi:4-amino-4-deoxy-L-arabinose transferase-like glycosyltransferase
MDVILATFSALGLIVGASLAVYDLITRTPNLPGLWWRRELVALVLMAPGGAGVYAVVYARTNEQYQVARTIAVVGIVLFWPMWWRLIKYRQAHNIGGLFRKTRM